MAIEIPQSEFVAQVIPGDGYRAVYRMDDGELLEQRIVLGCDTKWTRARHDHRRQRRAGFRRRGVQL
jgi:hypothetical protein